ncbi:MAG: hypothetical protein RL430_1904 [Actinomycetota bacterium]|jgi:hypothetical protein
MTAAGIDLLLARREAESEMRETCTVTAAGAGSPGEWNPVTLQHDAPDAATVYTGKCKVRFGNTRARQGEAGGQLYAEQDLTISFPVEGTTSIVKDCVVEITGSADDAALVGAKFRITASRAQSNATSRRLPAKETQ